MAASRENEANGKTSFGEQRVKPNKGGSQPKTQDEEKQKPSAQKAQNLKSIAKAKINWEEAWTIKIGKKDQTNDVNAICPECEKKKRKN